MAKELGKYLAILLAQQEIPIWKPGSTDFRVLFNSRCMYEYKNCKTSKYFKINFEFTFSECIVCFG